MPRVSPQFVNDCHKEITSLRAKVAYLVGELAPTSAQKLSVWNLAARMEKLAAEPAENHFVPISPETLRDWARQIRLL